MKMEKGMGLLAALFLCINFDNDMHRKLKGLFMLTDRSPRDGYIGLDEFISIILDKDFNGDNSISRQEWISVDTGIGLFDVATANRIFQAFDTDNNDAITLPDVIATFNTIDATVKRDGKVSAFEFLIAYIRLVTAIPNKKNL